MVEAVRHVVGHLAGDALDGDALAGDALDGDALAGDALARDALDGSCTHWKSCWRCSR